LKWKECGTGERCGFEPVEQRTDVDCAGDHGFVGDWSLAYDGAGEDAVADVGIVGIFRLPRNTRAAAFAVGLDLAGFVVRLM
jgi:hypothetical protein